MVQKRVSRASRALFEPRWSSARARAPATPKQITPRAGVYFSPRWVTVAWALPSLPATTSPDGRVGVLRPICPARLSKLSSYASNTDS
jgi:hypothetical protein